MTVLSEQLARERVAELRREAERSALAARLVVARRWQRRAESASRRARLALAAVR
ncbi:MAG: hypothetical protein M3Z02_02915 [Actinomycetota bacterium]|nr:hypothetical protein [Actinomycetota bacterium]